MRPHVVEVNCVLYVRVKQKIQNFEMNVCFVTFSVVILLSFMDTSMVYRFVLLLPHIIAYSCIKLVV